MFKPVPSVRLLRALRASIQGEELVCSFCRPYKPRKAPRLRYSTRIIPTTSVNAQTIVPEEYRELHEQLSVFGKTAAIYVNTSQLQLALKNLETKDSITRIAVLGVNDHNGPLQLVRSLLADPLSPEAPWEKELQRVSRDGKALLIRAGFKVSLESSHPLLCTLTIPSQLLEQNKIELLLHQVALEDGRSIEPTEEVLSSLLSPSLHSQQSFSGRTTSVTYPVHKTILLENGFGSFLSLAGLLQSRQGRTASRMVQIVTNVTWDVVPSDQSKLFFVNIERGLHAIETFRESLGNSIAYEREWLSSGLPSLVPVILPQTKTSDTPKLVVLDLIKHVLDETELALLISETESKERGITHTVGNAPREQLQDSITVWAEEAHTEFRAGLASILQSRAWRKLAWWKLLWRIDDVEVITSEAIRRTYLIEAEKNIMFIAGRTSQAGLLEDDYVVGWKAPRLTELVSEATEATMLSDDLLHEPARSTSRRSEQLHWPMQIGLSRSSILQETIPPLAASAQRYLLSALSVTGLTSLTSTLAYLSVSTTTLYEVGTVAAFGLVYSAYRLQTQWETARRTWIAWLQIEGKRTLDQVEKMSREVVETGGRSKLDEVGANEREDARFAIEKVRESLAKLEKSSSNHEAS